MGNEGRGKKENEREKERNRKGEEINTPKRQETGQRSVQ